MATRRYSVNPQDADFQVTEAVGSVTVSKSIELTVDWDGLIAAGLSGQQARMQVALALEKILSYLEGGKQTPASGKFAVNA